MKIIARESFEQVSPVDPTVTESHVNDIKLYSRSIPQILEDGTIQCVMTLDMTTKEDADAAADIVEAVLNTQRGELQMNLQRGIPFMETIFSSPDRLQEWENAMKQAISQMEFITKIEKFETNVENVGTTHRDTFLKVTYNSVLKTKFSDDSVTADDTRTITWKTIPVPNVPEWDIYQSANCSKFKVKAKNGESIVINIKCTDGSVIDWDMSNPNGHGEQTIVGEMDLRVEHTYWFEGEKGEEREYVISLGPGIVHFEIDRVVKQGALDTLNAWVDVISSEAWASTVIDASYTYNGCSQLRTMCKWTNYIENIAYCYAGCRALTELKPFGSSIRNCSHAYEGCSSLVYNADFVYMPQAIRESGEFDDCYVNASKSVCDHVAQSWGGNVIEFTDIRYYSSVKVKKAGSVNTLKVSFKTDIISGIQMYRDNGDGTKTYYNYTNGSVTTSEYIGVAATASGSATITVADDREYIVNFSLGFSALVFGTVKAGIADKISKNTVSEEDYRNGLFTGRELLREAVSYGCRIISLENFFCDSPNLVKACEFNDASKSVKGCFANCGALVEMAGLSKANTWKNNQTCAFCFYRCKKLIAPNLAAFGSSVSNASYCFYECEKVTSSPAMWSANVTDVSYCYYGCVELGGTPAIWGAKIKDAKHCYEGCVKLNGVAPQWTPVIEDAEAVFKNCVKMGGAFTLLPSGSNYMLRNVKDAFNGCTGEWVLDSATLDTVLMPPLGSGISRITSKDGFVANASPVLQRAFLASWGGWRPDVRTPTISTNCLGFAITMEQKKFGIHVGLNKMNGWVLVYGVDLYPKYIQVITNPPNGTVHDADFTFNMENVNRTGSTWSLYMQNVDKDSLPVAGDSDVVKAAKESHYTDIVSFRVLESYSSKTTLTTVLNYPKTVTNMEAAFKECVSLQTIPNEFPFDAVTNTGVITLKEAFRGCVALTGTSAKNLPTWPSTCADVNSCYYGCENLRCTGDFPAWNNVMEDVRYCFYGCKNLGGQYPEWGDNIKYADYCFYGCETITGSIKPWKEKMESVSFCYFDNKNCAGTWTSLLSELMPTSAPDLGGTTASDKHTGCVTGASEALNGAFFATWGGTFTYVPLEVTLYQSSTSATARNFLIAELKKANEDTLRTQIDWGEGSGFVDVILPSAESATNVGHTFAKNKVLDKKVKISNCSLINITKGAKIDSVDYTKSLTYVTGVEDKSGAMLNIIGNDCFFRGYGSENTYLTTFNGNAVTHIGNNAFCLCTALGTLNIAAVSEIGSRAFAGCKLLTALTLNALISIGDKGFIAAKKNGTTSKTDVTDDAGSASLTQFVAPMLSQIGASCFKNQKMLTRVDCGESNTEDTGGYLGSQAFFKAFVAPVGVTSTSLRLNACRTIGANACEGIGAAKIPVDVYLGVVQDIKTEAFKNALMSSVEASDDGGDLTIRTDAFYGAKVGTVTLNRARTVETKAFRSVKLMTGSSSIEVHMNNVTNIGANAFDELPSVSLFEVQGDASSKGLAVNTPLTVATSAFDTVKAPNGTFIFASLHTAEQKAFYKLGSDKNNKLSLFDADSEASTRDMTLGKESFKSCFIDTIRINRAKTIGESAFASATFLAIEMDFVTSLGKSAFDSAKGTIESIRCEGSASVLGGYNAPLDIGESCFENITATDVSLRSIRTIGASAFKGTTITRLDCESGASNFGISIGANAFASAKITTIGISRATSVGASAFKSAAIQTLVLNNVKNVGTNAFEGFQGNSTIFLNGITAVDNTQMVAKSLYGLVGNNLSASKPLAIHFEGLSTNIGGVEGGSGTHDKATIRKALSQWVEGKDSSTKFKKDYITFFFTENGAVEEFTGTEIFT